MISTHDLNGLWRFQPDAVVEGQSLGYHTPAVSTRFWREVAVPCVFDSCGPAMGAYEGVGWFRREFSVDAADLGHSLAIHFEGVNNDAEVWVNGEPVGGHVGPFLPFEVAINGAVHAGMNTLVVRVDNTRRVGEIPGLERGWRPFGGILRDVRLLVRPLIHIASHTIDCRADGSVTARLAVGNDGETAELVPVSLTIAGQLVANSQVEVGPGSSVETELAGSVAKVEVWSPDSPNLYPAVLAAGEDQVELRVGFRTIKVSGTSLLLNGEPIYLKGFNRHEDTFKRGPLPDIEQVKRDLQHMKALGANFIRLCHYPHNTAELDLCDELGLLVMGEVPVYWWKGDPEGLAAGKKQIAEMMHRDASHPSLIIWGVSNETEEEVPAVIAGNDELVRFAKELDATRIVTHVACHWSSGRARFAEDDIICLNGYPSWPGWGERKNSTQSYEVGANWWRKELAGVRQTYPTKPILITEFGYPAMLGVGENALGEDAQVAAIQAEAAAFDGFVTGMAIWCYADHPWPEDRWMNTLTTSPFGVVTRDRRGKLACNAVRHLFGGAEPTPWVPDPDNVPVTMVRPHMRDIPEYSFPEGYSIRPMRPGEEGLWLDIQRDAEPHFEIDPGLFAWEFGGDCEAIGRRCFLMIDAKGLGVGTISAWYSRDFQGQDYGRIHWVSVRPSHQGKGLARAAMTYTLREMAKWHDRACLDTSTGRPSAIRIYQEFGFEIV